MPDAKTMPDHHDAHLLVSLAQWGTMAGLDDAVAQVLSAEFDTDTASAGDAAVRRVLSFCETVGTLTKNGLLNSDLVHDWIWIEGLWERVGPAALRQRERFGNPALYENFEALAASTPPR